MTDHPSTREARCPDALLPDGPKCPRCGGERGASGIDGGSWVHLAPSALPGVREPAEPTPSADEIYDQSCACIGGPKGDGTECKRCGGYTIHAMQAFMARQNARALNDALATIEQLKGERDEYRKQCLGSYTAYLTEKAKRGEVEATAHVTAERTRETDNNTLSALDAGANALRYVAEYVEQDEAAAAAKREFATVLERQRDLVTSLSEDLTEAYRTAGRLLEENAKMVESQTNWLRTAERLEGELKYARKMVRLSEAAYSEEHRLHLELRATAERYQQALERIRDGYRHVDVDGEDCPVCIATDALASSLPAPLPAPEAT